MDDDWDSWGSTATPGSNPKGIAVVGDDWSTTSAQAGGCIGNGNAQPGDNWASAAVDVSGGYGGGGRGDGGNSSGCRKCGEDGHFARECPNAAAGGPRTCRICNDPGHIARDCTSKGTNNRPTIGNGGGNWSSDPNNNSGERSNECFSCKQTGHMSKECPNPRLGPDGKPVDNYVPDEITDADALFEQGITTGINFARYADVKVEVSGDNVPAPIDTFQASGLRELLLQNVNRAKYTTPTPIQKYGIPIIMAGRDVMGCAQTGSGKTAAFVLPILNNLIAQDVPSNAGNAVQTPQVLVLTPTRELAIQIHQEFVKFAINSAIKAQLAYGGAAVRPQMDRIRKGTNVLIATPGRLKMFVENGEISFDQIQYLVLDEADKMLDMGFMSDIQQIGCHPSMNKDERQTLMFSATFPQEIQQLARQFLKPSYTFVAVGIVGGANSDVEQRVIEARSNDKRELLKQMLQDTKPDEKVIIFVGTKRIADFLTSFLCQENMNATSIHGDRLQRERELAINEFKRGIRQFLLATAVAARGLDIPHVAHVINYDMPTDIDEYVHRIGRTGRVGNTGKATSFFDPDRDTPLAPQLVHILVQAQQEVPEFLQQVIDNSGGYAYADAAAGKSMFGGRDIRNFGSRGGGGGGGGGEGGGGSAAENFGNDSGWGQAAGGTAAADDGFDQW